MPVKLKLENKKFNKLTVIRYSHTDNNKKRIWECICDCGTLTLVPTQRLQNGENQSCGCYKNEKRITHGHTIKKVSRTYETWSQMKKRCYNPNNDNYNLYGGRGIKVCNRWLESFENFLSDMGIRPPNTSIDRIDVNGNYEPSNCRWATPKIQAKNKRRWE